MTARRGERGSVTVELTLVVPALVLVLGLLVAGGRLWFARATVVEAAQSAARAASLARTAGAAGADGRAASIHPNPAGLSAEQNTRQPRPPERRVTAPHAFSGGG